MLELHVDLGQRRVEHPDRLLEQLLAGLVALQHDDARFRHARRTLPSGLDERIELQLVRRRAWIPRTATASTSPGGRTRGRSAGSSTWCRGRCAAPHWESSGRTADEPRPGGSLRRVRRERRSAMAARLVRHRGEHRIPDALLLGRARRRLGEGRRPLALARSGLEDHQRDLALGPLLVVGEAAVGLRPPRATGARARQGVAVRACTGRHASSRPERLYRDAP